MNSVQLGLIVLSIVIFAGVAWYYFRYRRTGRLRSSFGREYDRLVHETGDRSRAERELAERERRVHRLELRQLADGERERFAEDWRREQQNFVDDPRGAVMRADAMVTEVMRARGYPMGEFERRAADISVEHPHMVENYRTAHAIAEGTRNGTSTTEDFRQAMVCYRALFEDLLERQVTEREPVAKS